MLICPIKSIGWGHYTTIKLYALINIQDLQDYHNIPYV